MSALQGLIATRYSALGFRDKPDDPLPEIGLPVDGEVGPHPVEVNRPGPISGTGPEEAEQPGEGDRETQA
jgi:hypothetical protein